MKTNTPRFLSLLAMIYITILLGSAIICNKLIATPWGSIAAGSLTGPFWFILSDIIAEVYGYYAARQIFWFSMIIELVAIIAIYSLVNAPSPTSWHGASAYAFVTGDFFKVYFAQFFAIVMAWYINVRLLMKWKLLLKGRYFWLRSIGSSGIGAIIFSFISPTLILYDQLTLHSLVTIAVWSSILKIAFFIIFALPANFITNILKKIEKSNGYDTSFDFNPFRAAE